MAHTIGSILQVIVGLGLLNVWLLRRQSSTAYRGGDAKNRQVNGRWHEAHSFGGGTGRRWMGGMAGVRDCWAGWQG